jgi:hypothetical protein
LQTSRCFKCIFFPAKVRILFGQSCIPYLDI